MRRTINGIVYDTATATQIAQGDHGHPSSDAFWALYRKENGSYFELVADHDGVQEGLYPLTKRQARAWLERHANHLVEEQFGPDSEIAAPRFSRATLVAAVDLLAAALTTYSTLKTLLLRLGAEVATRCDEGNLRDRYNTLIEYLDEDETRRTDRNDFLLDAVVEAAAHQAEQRRGGSTEYQDAFTAFTRQLSLDGFVVIEGVVRSALPEELGLSDAQDEVRRLLVEHGFGLSRGHLELARSTHSRGEWAAANGQIRCFVESLLEAIADRLDPGGGPSKNGSVRGDRLAQTGFLQEDLGEWGDGGKNFTNGLMKRLHPAGAHPGLSDEEDSTFRLHLVLVSAKLWLVRFDRRMSRP